MGTGLRAPILSARSGSMSMASSGASSVAEYLNELPEDRRGVVSRVRDVILWNLPEGYQEAMNWGMISYEVPLDRYPDTYNEKPLGKGGGRSIGGGVHADVRGVPSKPQVTGSVGMTLQSSSGFPDIVAVRRRTRHRT